MSTTLNNNWKDETALNRHQIISPLLDDSLDPQKRLSIRKTQAEKHGISVRSVYRYETAYRNGGFASLKPTEKDKRPSPKLPANFPELLEEAIQLKREVPSRSVNQIIAILEMEEIRRLNKWISLTRSQ